MSLPGVSTEKDLKPLLKKLFETPSEVYYFAAAASGPREGVLLLDKKTVLKRKEVQEGAEAEAKAAAGKPVKMEVMTGECRLDAKSAATLRLTVYGKAPAKTVSCVEHLLVRGPYKAIGFVGVILEEVEEPVPGGNGALKGPGQERGPTERPAAMKEEHGPTERSATMEPTAQDLTALWKARIAEWSPVIKGAIEAKGPQAAEILKSLAQANALSKPGGDLAQALETLAACHQMALAAAPPTASRPAPAPLQLAPRLKELLQRQQVLFAQNPAARSTILPIAQWAAQLVTSGNERAVEALDKLEAALRAAELQQGESQTGESKSATEAQPVAPPTEATPTDAPPPERSSAPREAALENWSRARGAAVEQLERLARAFQASTHPKAELGMQIIARSIAMNLTKRPESAQQVAELARYVETDDLFVDAETPNPYGFVVQIRQPLLDAIRELGQHVA